MEFDTAARRRATGGGVDGGGAEKEAAARELEAAIKRYLALTNDAPKPFVWTKTADEILESVARFCRRTSGSGH